MSKNNSFSARFIRSLVVVAAAASMTAVGTMPASAEELASASTSNTAGSSVTSAGVVTIVGTAKAFRPARQNGSANLTVTYDCNATATPALRTQVTLCRIITDTGFVYDDPSEIFPGEEATSAGTITLPGSSAVICAAGAGRMVVDGSLQGASAPCRLISLAV
jgi:hypothetical protein